MKVEREGRTEEGQKGGKETRREGREEGDRKRD